MSDCKYGDIYVFWKTNAFPFVDGSEVSDINREGGVRIVSESIIYVEPIRIVPKQDGLKVQARIDQITTEYYKNLKSLNEEYLKRIHEFAPYLKVKNNV